MCSHSEKIKESIDHLVQRLYPKVKQQFKLIDTTHELSISNRDERSNAIIGLLNEMNTEFHSLYTYETRLVFPSILNALDKSKSDLQNYHPNITDLVFLTKKKEHRLIQLTSELVSELNNNNFEDTDQLINTMIFILQNEFVESRHHWNAVIHESIDSCSSFKSNKLSEINT